MLKKRVVFVLTSLIVVCTQAAKRPNIIFILSDDAGFEEFGIYDVKKGEKSNTPNIDKLGERGVAFAHCWGQAICGPSRAMLISGNYAVNNGAYDNKLAFLPGMKGRIGTNRENRPHFTRILKDAGYKVAVSGKWHNPGGYMVLQDAEALGLDAYCVWDASPEPFEERLGHKLVPDQDWEIAAISGEPKISRYWKPGIIQDDKVMPTTMADYGPDIFNGYVLDFIEANAEGEQPFLMYYTQVLPHGAHCPTPDLVAQGEPVTNESFKKGTEKGAKMFHAQVNYADKLVGKVVAKVEEMGIADNTIILYASDNGTTSSAKGKGVEYGVHVPFMVAGAGIKQRGMTTELMDFTDVLPTLADFAGATIPEKYNIDGSSLKPFLTGESETTKPAIYSFPGPTRLVRTKEFMLEAVCPLYDQPQGRFYKTNESWDGRGYENITHNPEFADERKKFDRLLQVHPTQLPDSWDDPLWKDESVRKGFKFYTNPKMKERHLQLPMAYRFYDPSF
ncbi:Arylsulfatase [Pontiella desulfatans]|uniref:Arylsulfatase n=1 Tax=Pontiella desulfatans TaxID=2750659 RepID=A0A6C2U8D4_PONDE|nr:sulfatase-like hydrolase/transferase [Pontiella desulfatans]SPS74042.1 sulfatase S1_24 [Kiritimatiellales bacterium]VGO16372.1 Arylsulfatase [Pontiella desulfatans]